MIIRKTIKTDFQEIRKVHTGAFGRPDEAELTLKLLSDPEAQPVLSLIAYDGDEAVGHILFTKAEISCSRCAVDARILAPLAVVPGCQKQGIGGRLINAGISQLEESGAVMVFVLGDPAYYSRFGFASASAHGLNAPYRLPPEYAEAWMVRELKIGGLDSCTGTLKCAGSLMREEYWC